MAILVKKFGGSSVATPEKIHGIVNRVLKEKKPGDKIVIVVSAMGDSTDDLLALAGRVNPKCPNANSICFWQPVNRLPLP